jgi:hypothetical protein
MVGAYKARTMLVGGVYPIMCIASRAAVCKLSACTLQSFVRSRSPRARKGRRSHVPRPLPLVQSHTERALSSTLDQISV